MPAQPLNGFLIHCPSFLTDKAEEGMAFKIRLERGDFPVVSMLQITHIKMEEDHKKKAPSFRTGPF
jgi:hypothetical protein